MTTVDVGTSSLYHIEQVIAALGATITDRWVTQGACGYTTLAVQSAPEAHACAECGTTTATTYVVTQLDPEDPSPETRTEVCRSCDDELRLRPVLDALQANEERIRPTTSDADWDRDDEEEELVADTYDEAAKLLAGATGLAYPAVIE